MQKYDCHFKNTFFVLNRNQKVDVKFGRTDERCYDSPPTVIGTRESGFYWPAGSIYSTSKKTS